MARNPAKRQALSHGPRAVSAAVGAATSVLMDGQGSSARFVVVDAYLLCLEGPHPPGTPQPEWDKTKAFGRAARWIGERGEKFTPAKLLKDSEGTEIGSPVVTPKDRRVIIGRTRAIMIRVLHERNPKKLAEWKAALLKAAPRFGLDPEEVTKIEFPILVRLLDGSSGEQSWNIVEAAKGIEEEARNDSQENARRHRPEALKDYYFPKTGRKNPDGSDERLGKTGRKNPDGSDERLALPFWFKMPSYEWVTLLRRKGSLTLEEKKALLGDPEVDIFELNERILKDVRLRFDWERVGEATWKWLSKGAGAKMKTCLEEQAETIAFLESNIRPILNLRTAGGKDKFQKLRAAAKIIETEMLEDPIILLCIKDQRISSERTVREVMNDNRRRGSKGTQSKIIQWIIDKIGQDDLRTMKPGARFNRVKDELKKVQNPGAKIRRELFQKFNEEKFHSIQVEKSHDGPFQKLPTGKRDREGTPGFIFLRGDGKRPIKLADRTIQNELRKTFKDKSPNVPALGDPEHPATS